MGAKYDRTLRERNDARKRARLWEQAAEGFAEERNAAHAETVEVALECRELQVGLDACCETSGALYQRVDALQVGRDDLGTKLVMVAGERDKLQAEVEVLKAELSDEGADEHRCGTCADSVSPYLFGCSSLTPEKANNCMSDSLSEWRAEDADTKPA